MKGYVQIRSTRIHCFDYDFNALQIEVRRSQDQNQDWQTVDMIDLERFLSCGQARLDFIQTYENLLADGYASASVEYYGRRLSSVAP